MKLLKYVLFHKGEGPQWRAGYARRGGLERWANLWENLAGAIGWIWRGRGPTEYHLREGTTASGG